LSDNRHWLVAAGIIASAAAAAPVGEATVRTSFGVGATVVAGCRILPGQAKACAARAPATTIAAPQPVVRFSRDPKAGVVVETVEF
jgi:hypothetical protein